MKAFKATIVFFFMFLALSFAYPSKKKPYKPCKQLTLFFHDVIYDGHNGDNATSAIVAARDGGNRTTLTPGLNHFGNIVIFDDPITQDNSFHSPPVGRAQGMYMYDAKNAFTAWLAFSFVLNSSKYGRGSISFVGADPIAVVSRDISIVGCTGGYFMRRGVATVSTDAYESAKYFRVKIDMKFYDCW